MNMQPESRPQPHTRSAGPTRCRAAKACRVCHEKRVKCDASERGTPCTRCEQRQLPGCTLMQSRRGIYTRKPRRKHQEPTAEGCTNALPSADLTTDAAAAATATGSTTAADDADAGTANTAASTGRSPPEHEGVSSAPSTGCTSSYREISWATTFDHLLERYHNTGDVLNKYSITYIGEAFPLGIVLKNFREGGANRHQLHHPGPPCGDQDTATAGSPRLTHPPGIRPEEIAFLEAKQAFTAPSDETVDALIAVFFERVFPLYPLVNPSELLLQHKSRRIPWMLLHALCFMSATYCSIRVIHRAGFDSRTEARSSFYDKAKALFDMSYEGNKIVALQVCIMMSFWGGGPSNYWNFYTWICTGVTIAETIGFHRSMAGANIDSQDRSLIKRLWWILVIRDAMCASIVGRPFRIHLEHCDMDPLTEDDFIYDADLGLECMDSPLVQQSGAYQIHATKLALILRHIIAVRFYPRKQDTHTPLSLQDMMIAWRSELPEELKWSDCINTHSNVFVSTLRILYNHNIVLAYVHSSIGSEPDLSVPSTSFPQRAVQEEIISDAAQQIASTSCNVVITDDGQLPPHELFHGLFVASVVFYMQTNSQNAVVARAGVSGLTNCKMALHAARDTWDASPWIAQLFDKVLCLSLASSRAVAEEGVDGVGMDAGMGFNDFNAFDLDGSGMAGCASWPNHLFLANLFDGSMNPSSSFFMSHAFGDGTG